MVGGASAGGGLAAGTALKARDVGEVKLLGQLLRYPMLDHSNTTPSSHAIQDTRAWNYQSNIDARDYYPSSCRTHPPTQKTHTRATLPPTLLATIHCLAPSPASYILFGWLSDFLFGKTRTQNSQSPPLIRVQLHVRVLVRFLPASYNTSGVLERQRERHLLEFTRDLC